MYEDPVKEMLVWMKMLLLTAFIILGVRQFLFEPVIVEGGSMQPSFHENDKLVLSKATTIGNFDTIVFFAPDGSRFIKRVIGVPGDHLQIAGGEILLNGQPLEEPYLDEGGNTGITAPAGITSEFSVPPDCYYVLGDNRGNSTDSRVLGFIQEQDVIGEVKFRFAPLRDFGFVE
ncbi:signal peptidase I [Planococcus sp. SSTMD024]|uniref:signal peptidase I n=1 Tax=Planococcus sp. SSTMD024 TaxID=3242163 RepID=UPI00351E1678